MSEVTSRASDRAAQFALVALIAVALAAGGGPRGTGDAIVQLAALPVLALALLRAPLALHRRWHRAFATLLIAALAVTLLQLVPLPFELWRALGPREAIAQHLALAGEGSAWRALSLDTAATLRAAVSLTVSAAAWTLAASLSRDAIARVVQLTLLIALPMALLGFAQAAAAAHAWRPYDFHHPIGAIGTFANRNHFAALMAMLGPLAFAFGAQSQLRRDTPRALAWHALGAIFVLACALSFSRAGSALALLALLCTGIVLMRGARIGAGIRTAVVIALGLGAATAVYAWDGLAQRLTQDPADDLRWQYLRNGLETAQAYMPFGSGAGSFRWAYVPFEPVTDMVSVHADRAHNDALQTLIEFGIAGALLLVAALALLAWQSLRRIPIGEIHHTDHDSPARVIGVIVWVPVLHSLVDYPLRTLGIAVVFAVLLAWPLADGARAREHRGSATR
ncbi:O-antigen ligase family protein [Cognatilysobacter bugurensis]|nr:O-antigen ligase family protein [Lysobacter bugurensis]